MKQIDPGILTRYLRGEVTDADARALQSWLERTARGPEMLIELRRAWETAGRLPEARDRDAAWIRVQMRTAAGPALPGIARASGPPSAPVGAGRRFVSRYLRAAAVLLMLLSGGAVFAIVRGAQPGPMRAFTTPPGERTVLRLGDGSRVLMGPSTEVRLPVRFGSTSRTVHLEGAAEFEVAPDPRRPFDVIAAGTVTRVLGTRFVVRAYPGDSLVHVAVREGRVSLGSAGPALRAPLTLRGGEAARADSLGGARRLGPGRAAVSVGIGEARLAFRDAPLPEVLRELERWYPVRFVLTDPELERRHLTASFAGDPLPGVMEVLELVLQVRCERIGDVISITPRASPR